MSIYDVGIYAQSARNGLVRLRTLIILRWLAVVGQAITILISKFIIGLQIDLGLCFLAISASVLINLIAIFIFPANRRLPERDFLAMLLFDLIRNVDEHIDRALNANFIRNWFWKKIMLSCSL